MSFFKQIKSLFTWIYAVNYNINKNNNTINAFYNFVMINSLLEFSRALILVELFSEIESNITSF